MLEDNIIEGYTVVPKFGQIGYEITAFTLLKTTLNHKKGQEKEEACKRLNEWYMKQPNVILVADGQGIGFDAVCVSLHESYTDYAQFLRNQNSELSDLITETQTFLADLQPGVIIKPFHLKYLAKQKVTEERV